MTSRAALSGWLDIWRHVSVWVASVQECSRKCEVLWETQPPWPLIQLSVLHAWLQSDFRRSLWFWREVFLEIFLPGKKRAYLSSSSILLSVPGPTSQLLKEHRRFLAWVKSLASQHSAEETGSECQEGGDRDGVGLPLGSLLQGSVPVRAGGKTQQGFQACLDSKLLFIVLVLCLHSRKTQRKK